MRLTFGRKKTEDSGQRGVAAIEFALSMFFLVPFMLAVADYGYYFYIAMNVVEAQQAALQAASRVVVGDCSGTATAAQVAAKGAAQAAGVLQATTYLQNSGSVDLSTLITFSGNTPNCSNNPINPTWSMTPQADFRPLIGWVAPWMKHGATGKVRYTAHTMAMLGR